MKFEIIIKDSKNKEKVEIKSIWKNISKCYTMIINDDRKVKLPVDRNLFMKNSLVHRKSSVRDNSGSPRVIDANPFKTANTLSPHYNKNDKKFQGYHNNNPNFINNIGGI